MRKMCETCFSGKTLARSSFVFKVSVHTEALSANAFSFCKRQCCPYYIHVLLTSHSTYSPYVPLCSLIRLWALLLTLKLNFHYTLVIPTLSFTILSFGRTWSFCIWTWLTWHVSRWCLGRSTCPILTHVEVDQSISTRVIITIP